MLLRIIISNNNNILFKCGSIQVEKKERKNAITTLVQPPLVLRYLIVFFQIKISVNPKFFYISLMFVGSMTIYKQVPFKFSFVMKKRFIWIENDHPRTFLLFSCDKLLSPCKYWRYKFLSALNMASKKFRINLTYPYSKFCIYVNHYIACRKTHDRLFNSNSRYVKREKYPKENPQYPYLCITV